MGNFILGLFGVSIMACLSTGASLLWGLLWGYLLFAGYALRQGYTWSEVQQQSLEGIKTVKNILLVFFLIGLLTASWRASGTVAFIIYYAAQLIVPQLFYVLSFWLCAIISVLTGTSFGTVATMGVICMTMGRALEVNTALAGGAILSGIFVGDRCSPMSTSALLTAAITRTDIYKNLVNMLYTSLVPLLLTTVVYVVAGFWTTKAAISLTMLELFAQNFNLHPFTCVPAIVIVVLSLGRVSVKKTMLLSIVTALISCVYCQNQPVTELWRLAVYGYTSPIAELQKVMGGGGIFSMWNVFAIVLISSTYAPLFKMTQVLVGLQGFLLRAARYLTVFGSVILTSLLTGMLSCNQSLATILTNELCQELVPEAYRRALFLANSVIVLVVLIPWCIAGAIPLATIGAPQSAYLAACYLYLLPLYNLCQQNKPLRAS